MINENAKHVNDTMISSNISVDVIALACYIYQQR